MKKLLYLPLIYQGGNEQFDLYEAFSKVFEVKIHDHLNESYANDVLIELMASFQPDIVHSQFSEKIDPRVIKKLRKQYPKVIWTQWTGDCRPKPLPLIVQFGKLMDATLLASGLGQAEAYEEQGVKNIRYWQHAVAPWQFIKPLPAKDRSGIVMVANNYDQTDPSGDRLELAKRLTLEFPDFTAYGSGWPDDVRHGDPIPWTQQGVLYNRAFLTVGTNGINTVPGYWSDRPYIALAAGSPHLTHAVPGYNLPSFQYHNHDEAVKLIKTARFTPLETDAIAKLGQEYVRDHETWDHRVIQYQQILESL